MEETQSIGQSELPGRRHHYPDVCRNCRETLFDHFTVRNSLPLESIQEWQLNLPQKLWHWFKTTILIPISERVITLLSPENTIEKIIDNEVSALREAIDSFLKPLSPSQTSQRIHQETTLRDFHSSIEFLFEHFEQYIILHCKSVLNKYNELPSADKMRLIAKLKCVLLSGDIADQLHKELEKNSIFIALAQTHLHYSTQQNRYTTKELIKMIHPHTIIQALRKKLTHCAEKLDISYRQLATSWRPVSGDLNHLLEQGHLSPEAFCRLQKTYRQGIADTTESISQRPYVECVSRKKNTPLSSPPPTL